MTREAAPRTAAGRAEHDHQHRHCKTFCSEGDKYGEVCPVRERILAIEAEARAQERERIRRELRWIDMELKSGRVVRVYPQDVVLAILDAAQEGDG